MTDHDFDPERDPIRTVAHESAMDATPMQLTCTPDFMAWMRVVDDLADDVERTIRAEAEA